MNESKTPARKRHLTFDEAQIIRKKYLEGATQEELAAKYKCTQANISRILANKTLTSPPKRKLTNRTIQAIRYEQLSTDTTLTALAQKYNLKASEIFYIVTKRTYAWVKPSKEETALREKLAALKGKKA